jgi:hypothetical protein
MIFVRTKKHQVGKNGAGNNISFPVVGSSVKAEILITTFGQMP